MKILHKIYRKVFPSYNQILEKHICSCSSILDVGCGSSSPIRFISKKMYKIGVDSFLPSIEKSKKQKIHDKYFNIDVLEIGDKFKENSFDCVIALDLIEHLTKTEGLKLIKMMERIAKKQVIIFTPNGFLEQGIHDNNDYQIHKSGWDVEEMKKKNYKVVGVNGWKYLKGERCNIRFRPKLFWNIFSDLTQIITKYFSKYAFHILCIKLIQKNKKLI